MAVFMHSHTEAMADTLQILSCLILNRDLILDSKVPVLAYGRICVLSHSR